MALFRCGDTSNVEFSKCALCLGTRSTGAYTIAYDNGSGMQYAAADSTVNNDSDLLSWGYVTGTGQYTATFKTTCNVIFYDGTNHFEGVKNSGDTITAVQASTPSLFVYTD